MQSNELLPLGWRTFFQQQLTLDEWEHCHPARVFDVQRSAMTVRTGAGSVSIELAPSMPAMTVGDWILLDGEQRFVRLLDRTSLFSRRAAGSAVRTQLVAANIDTVFVVCAMNQDFSLNRIERYLAVCHEAQVEPVIVLSKADLCDNPEDYVRQVQSLDRHLLVVAVNGLDATSAAALAPWCNPGSTVAFLGSSGVGKSTLVNTLLGKQVQATGASRADDDEGRHTTTSRSLHCMPGGGLLLDTPGMRELQLADCGEGIERAFADIAELASRCRFQDCRHQSEPGCAVLAAVEEGYLDERRLGNFHKLQREEALNSATLAEKRARDRARGRMYRKVLAGKDRGKR